MTSIKVSLSGLPGVQAALESAPRKVEQALAETVDQMFAIARRGADRHTKTSNMLRSLQPIRTDALNYSIVIGGQNAPYAPYVHDGTKPHTIKANKKRALRLPSAGGGFFFGKSVKHPGYRGDPFMAEAAAAAPQIFSRILNQALKN